MYRVHRFHSGIPTHWYKCKSAHESVILIPNKVSQALMSANVDVRTTMDTALNVNVNTAMVLSISRVPVIEVEARMNAEMSRIVYSCAESGMFGVTISSKITETGCSWWTGSGMKTIAKLRSRTGEDMAAKIVLST